MANTKLSPPKGIEGLQEFDWKEIVAAYPAGDKKGSYDFPPLGLARALGAMIFVHQMDIDIAAAKFSRTAAWARDRLKILYLPLEVQELFSADKPEPQRLRTDDAKYIIRHPSGRQMVAAQAILRSKNNKQGSRTYASPVVWG